MAPQGDIGLMRGIDQIHRGQTFLGSRPIVDALADAGNGHSTSSPQSSLFCLWE